MKILYTLAVSIAITFVLLCISIDDKPKFKQGERVSLISDFFSGYCCAAVSASHPYYGDEEDLYHIECTSKSDMDRSFDIYESGLVPGCK